VIRRKSKRPGAEGKQVAPANPVSATGAPPPNSVPPGGDQPPPVVIDELMAAFSTEEVPKASKLAPPLDLDGPQVAELPPADPEGRRTVERRAGDARGDGTAAASTRAMSPAESGPAGTVAHIEAAPPPKPAPVADLVAEPTRRSVRRSRKEAKREAKREKKRLAEHERAQKKARKQTSRARRKARRQGEVQGAVLADRAVESDVRIITPDDPSVPPVLPSAPLVEHGSPSSMPPESGSPGTTVQIGGDDLPDAVYVEGDLGGAASNGGGNGRSTVFIDEDPGHADVVSIDVATSAARMEPRIRERRIAVKRAVGRRRLKWVAIVAGVVIIAVAVFAVLGSGLFEITTVRVDGRVYSGGPSFDAVVEELEGSNVLRVDTEEAERALERIPWVEDARVTTDFPNGARIEVREREPSIAYQGTDGQYRVLDREGRVLDVIPGQPVAYLELFVIGSPAVDLDAGQKAPPGYRAAATLAQALTPEIRARVVSISCDADATDLRMLLTSDIEGGDIEVRFGAAQDLVDKLVRLQTVLTDPDPERVPTELIDVSGSDVNVR
jgi:cell division protein FtsQ